MLKIILVVVLNLLGLLRVEGQIVQNGQCDPNIPLATDFDFSEFQGTWYEISRSAVGGADCSQYDFLSGAEIQVQNTGVNANFAEQRSGVATLQPGTAKFTLTFPFEAPQDFWILDTNNIVYAVGYRCENISPTQRSITIWTLGRQRAYPNNLVPAFINNLLVNTLGITIDELHDVDHSDDACYVLPIIQPGNPIVLPGQCDENIPVVQGFEAARFEGVWHEIAAYHSINSVNLCSRAEYRLDGTEILVENSQVVNQALDVMTGRARLATTDGSAKLLVTLDTGNNIETDLYILATDYDNYAVSYSCSNLPNNEKRVYSWILGRSRQLSAETQAAVDSVVSSELVLNYQYFTQTDQSDEACFYFPEFVPNTPIVFRGQCDLNIPVVTNFDPVKYMGTWHDIESYFGVFQAHECRNANYELVDGAVRVVNTQVTDQTLLSIVGEAVLANNDGLGELIVNFPTTNSSVTVSQNYWIMDTDYESYALVYSCVNINENEKQVFSWKLSRSKELTAQASAAINNIISQHQVLDQRYYQKVDQSREACFYFPEPEPSTVVVFPGLCDSNIPVVQNFDLKLFEGTWHEIEAYPKEQQQGQCINHQYETGATGNTLNLKSSQVTDQFLGVTDGTLSFTSTDGSAKMNINIVVNGQIINIPFWILDTDYSDYAMAYACVQQNNDFRSVYSWVLSRTKALSTPAREKINNVIQNVEVLGQQYYVPIDQSDEACFHLPELAPGEPIILPGQCDPNVPTIANFEAGRYLGEWRLIESYPTEFQAGTCNRATYSLGENGVVNVFNTEVVNQELQTIEGTAVLTDESGKLLVKFPDTTQDADYWVLDTDYDSYALVYSCRNINSDQRRVWSWKMSRTNSLTPEATSKINEIVNKVNVLNNRYYETIDTSETGCFYFPAPEQGKAVRFRGTCENVQAVPNFDAFRYTGIWHNIELYPSGSQDGSCYNAYYELLSDSVQVVNSQVVDQKLDTMIGSAVVASTDNSGKLEVTFNIGGVDQKMTLWVLATDYESYSLAYSCQEFGEERQVWSWKLSRTKQLTAAANVLINTAMAGVQVLDNRYYWPVDQTDEGCFYFPEVHPGVPVVFPGRCPTNVPFVQNFNFDQFAGIWHEIAAYPLGEDLGECSYHEYELLASVRFAYASVSNLALNFYNGSAMFAPGNTNNEGRLVITIPLSNTEFELPFYILAVDYDDYVLGYGCVDLGPVSTDVDRRIVYSWKLSRSKQLSAAAITAFNQVISSVDVLRDEYYEVVDQSDEACFFLPEVTGDVVIFPGVCDQDIPVVQDFRAADYLGRWYLIESYPSEFQDGSCNDARYTPGANGVVDVLNSQVVDQTLEEVAGTAVASTDGTGKLTVQFPDAPGPSQYWILDTDYLNYALVYSCRNIVGSNQRAVYSWKLSRTQSLSVAATNAINNVVDSINVLDNRFFNKIDHSPEGCFYFPEPKPLQQVRFRGTCDQTIGVVQNFDAARYLGLWHLIESYPSNFQLGTCNNAFYSLGATAVDVFNTQVIDQTLDTMSGLAVASADGTGKLTVSFPIAGTDQFTQTPYWILATDYDTYSLVYTCVEVDDEYKQVFSWKLGRSKQLSPAAVTAINSVTSGIQVLDERYYQPIDQSREGCFYFPEPEPGKVVRFPGQCEDIDVVQNFDLSKFEGIWHEVEAYPKEQQQGQCVNHEYLPGAGASRQLLSESVIAQTLHVTQSTFAFTSTDGSAKMSITIAGSNPPVVIPFWILSTDYTDSALAYSCVNVNEDYRHVFSWKLSRTKTLSSAGAAAINAAMQSVDVVDQRYFEPIDQSDSACFHLPALEPGQDVVFPGQCDMNIPVVQNFDAGRYLNRWRMIESYASDFQSGGCNEATYTPGTDGTVDVYNTQVIDQRLDTMTGVAEVASTDGSGKLKVQFPNAPEPSDYWILDTDYDTYSLVYSCRNLSPDTRRVWAWKLSRDRTLSQAANEKINQIMQSINVLDQRYFQTIEQSDAACFYHPEADGKPVTYRGQCDPNIAVVNDFDPSLYQGIWYDMESYPQEFQDGTCPTAQYTLNGGIVNVVNTQVRGQTLDTIEATAVLEGNPSEAKLIVTFPVAGTDLTVDMPYWVLATDYNSYALVYSCQNINAEYRRVTSWKLSRTQTLTPESATAINAVMQQVPVLRQEYYVPRGHSEVDCFFYPDNNGGPVYLDGQCAPDNEVNVVTDFDAARFDGTWHEIARFPSQLQVGECAASQYEYTTENNFNVIMTIVNQELQTTFSGSGTVPAGNRGIINLDLNSNGLNVVGNLYCLDVDYDDFALMYSCRNVDSNRMQVYSWKLSRSKTGLSAAATNRINEIVSREDNLFEGYFEETPQDTNACFHYPVFDQLPDVITLHGPCDTSIRGVANFDAGRYLGKWIEIQKYPQPFQEGKCHRAEYSLGSAAVDVYNTQVVDQKLLVQTGNAVVASTDGTGELLVTFDVNGVINQANYIILATDYDSYALVYSCRNLDNGDRQVSSWKLSRSFTLSAEANSVMASVISSTQGLLQDYYTVTDQSLEACFYVPEAVPNQEVRLRGTCDGITGQANFDLQRYLGWWHEISSYPVSKETASTCLSTQYQQVGNQVQFEDTEVFDLAAQITRGTVVATTDGKLTRTWENGQVEEIWVLATDYDNYAMVFSCEKIDDEYVRVWSSKQSKVRTLPAAAEEVFAAVVAGNQLVIDSLFLPVAQSDAACFHYPEVSGQRVVLPGQCDENIPTQDGFELDKYTGTWYQLQRYPYPEVADASTCVGTRITAQNGNAASLLNWAVVDGELVTAEAQATVAEGSATLQVTVPIPDSTNATSVADLHILNTDYTTYALAYTCENINPFQRVVVAFILSRTRFMPVSSTEAIDAYMAQREEFRQDYFITVAQSDDCEEPSSSYLVKSSIALILLCYALQMLM